MSCGETYVLYIFKWDTGGVKDFHGSFTWSVNIAGVGG